MRGLSRYTLLLGVILFAACGGDNDSAGTSVSGSTAPEQAPTTLRTGDWTASADFGTFTFTVGASGASIEQIAYQFSAFTCGSVRHSGGITVSTPSGWPITGGQFDIRNDMSLMMSLIVTVRGTFQSSTTASGTWEVVSGGATCSGSWTSG